MGREGGGKPAFKVEPKGKHVTTGFEGWGMFTLSLEKRPIMVINSICLVVGSQDRGGTTRAYEFSVQGVLRRTETDEPISLNLRNARLSFELHGNILKTGRLYEVEDEVAHKRAGFDIDTCSTEKQTI